MLYTYIKESNNKDDYDLENPNKGGEKLNN